jgi:hypothetical protein
VAQVPGEGIATTEVGAPGASLLGTWVSAAATPSSETKDFSSDFPAIPRVKPLNPPQSIQPTENKRENTFQQVA